MIETPEEFEIIPAHHLAGLLFSKTRRTYPSGAQEILPAYSLDTATELIESCFAAIRADERQKAAEKAVRCVRDDFNSEMRDLWGDYEDSLLRAAIMAEPEEARG